MAKTKEKQGLSPAAFTLSAFGDEIDADLATQLRLLVELGIGYLELRSAWGINVLTLDDSQVAAIRHECERYSILVSCIGSPIGKSPLTDPLDKELSHLERIFQVAKAVGTRKVRAFSFYPPDDSSGRHQGMYLREAISRLSRMAHLAGQQNMILLLENEKGVVGDTPERCHAILKAIDSPNLRFVWDTANFVQVGVARPTERGWLLLCPYLAHVQMKDALLADGSVQVAGQGDGQVGELLSRLRDSGYRGFLALEPHLVMAGPTRGFSGHEGMRRAVSALRQLMARLGCVGCPR